MDEYISKQAMLKNLTTQLKCNSDNCETFSVVEVQSIKHGKWLNNEYDAHFIEYSAKCSVCGFVSTDTCSINEYHRYCEHCGARMDGVTNE